MQKTIVFCPTEDAAERMRIALINLNSDLVKENPDYCVRITGSDDYGKGKLDYFISVSSKFPVIATTSKLLSTGVDTKMVKLIALDQMINSMTEFKQIIGRGTRLREKEGKTSFVVMDFRRVTSLFYDPEWDGPIDIHQGFNPKDHQSSESKEGEEPYDPGNSDRIIPVIDKDGFKVKIINRTVSIYDTNSKLLRRENIIDYTKENIRGEYADLNAFIKSWRQDPKKDTVRNILADHGIDIESLKKEKNMEDVDDFDFICHIAYDQKPLTRKERAENVKKHDFFSKYSGVAKEVLEELLDKYMNQGIEEITTTDVLRLDPFVKYGKPSRIIKEFGGKELYIKAITDLQNAIYEYGVS